MPKNLKNISQEIDDFFEKSPTVNQKAWGVIHDFYNSILTYMENSDISKAELARRLNKSRASITQLFNKTPNVSLKKMIEIVDGIGLELKIDLCKKGEYIQKVSKKEVIWVVIHTDPSKYGTWNSETGKVDDVIFTNKQYVEMPINKNNYFNHKN